MIGARLRSPLAAFAEAWRAGEEAFYWDRPSDGSAMVGIGAEARFELSGPDRFAQARRLLRDLRPGARLVGGFAFDPRRDAGELWRGFGDGSLVLPRRTATGVVDESAPADGARLQLEDLRPADEWRELVERTARTIREDGLEKVVLARGVRVRADAPLDPAAALARLRLAYQSCTVFALARGGRCFLGATPERLVALVGRRVRVSSLAGTIRRGATDDEDRRLGEELLSSAKDREEHAVVVRTLRDQLADLCTELRVPGAPVLMKVRNVQHLYTPIEGRAAAGVTVLDLAERLHPTPALGGHPREGALAFIRENEELERGWYAGPVGWVDGRGDGDFAVAIRSALLTGEREAVLFAGCGIVGDSDPESEYQESCLKLRPMLMALGGEA